jgi:5'-deoxynucleotidase YfbR-like HD superfamily hydrolase
MASRERRRGVDCHTVFADALVHAAAEVVEHDIKFGVNAGAHECIKLARWLCRC